MGNFKFVLAAHEFGADPRLDHAILFTDDVEFAEYLVDNFDADDDYIIYEFKNGKFEVILEHINF